MWPEIWRLSSEPMVLKKTSKTSKEYNVLDIYVSNREHFSVSFPQLNTSGSGAFDLSNPYFVACCAADCCTRMCGISMVNFNDNTSKLISSIIRYHFYFQMRKFLRNPSRLNTYMSPTDINRVRSNLPVQYKWVWKFDYTRASIGAWLSKKKRGTVRNWRADVSRYGGQVGINYQQRTGERLQSSTDYKLFIAESSKGITRTGQVLLQGSVESYVYAILGSQAATRWPIVGLGAMSMQTQDVFKKTVSDTIIENSVTVAVGNMRKAVKATHVVLNTAITPGMILIPARMIILEKKIPGFNNSLLVASESMSFGVNPEVNTPPKEEPEPVEEKSSEKVVKKKPPYSYNLISEHETHDQRTGKLGAILVSSAMGSPLAVNLISRFI